jgi:hypothetical protein
MIGDDPHNGIVFTNQSTVTDLKGGFEALQIQKTVILIFEVFLIFIS